MQINKNVIYQIGWTNRAQLQAIAHFLYEQGFRGTEDTAAEFEARYYSENYHYIIIYPDGKTLGGNFARRNTEQPPLTMDELFTAVWPASIVVKLNDNHTATVTRENITVGCQTFTHAAIKELYEASVKLSS